MGKLFKSCWDPLASIREHELCWTWLTGIVVGTMIGYCFFYYFLKPLFDALEPMLLLLQVRS